MNSICAWKENQRRGSTWRGSRVSVGTKGMLTGLQREVEVSRSSQIEVQTTHLEGMVMLAFSGGMLNREIECEGSDATQSQLGVLASGSRQQAKGSPSGRGPRLDYRAASIRIVGRSSLTGQGDD